MKFRWPPPARASRPGGVRGTKHLTWLGEEACRAPGSPFVRRPVWGRDVDLGLYGAASRRVGFARGECGRTGSVEEAAPATGESMQAFTHS